MILSQNEGMGHDSRTDEHSRPAQVCWATRAATGQCRAVQDTPAPRGPAQSLRSRDCALTLAVTIYVICSANQATFALGRLGAALPGTGSRRIGFLASSSRAHGATLSERQPSMSLRRLLRFPDAPRRGLAEGGTARLRRVLRQSVRPGTRGSPVPAPVRADWHGRLRCRQAREAECPPEEGEQVV